MPAEHAPDHFGRRFKARVLDRKRVERGAQTDQAAQLKEVHVRPFDAERDEHQAEVGAAQIGSIGRGGGPRLELLAQRLRLGIVRRREVSPAPPLPLRPRSMWFGGLPVLGAGDAST